MLVGRLWYVDEGSLSQYLRRVAEERVERRKVLSRQMRNAWALGALLLCAFVVPQRADAFAFDRALTSLSSDAQTLAAPLPVSVRAFPGAVGETVGGWFVRTGDDVASSYLLADSYLSYLTSRAHETVFAYTLSELPDTLVHTSYSWAAAAGSSHSALSSALANAYVADAETPSSEHVAAVGNVVRIPADVYALAYLPSDMADSMAAYIQTSGEALADFYSVVATTFSTQEENPFTQSAALAKAVDLFVPIVAGE